MIERGCGEMQKAELPSRVIPLLLTNCLVRGQSIFLMLFLASQYIVIYRSFFYRPRRVLYTVCGVGLVAEPLAGSFCVERVCRRNSIRL